MSDASEHPGPDKKRGTATPPAPAAVLVRDEPAAGPDQPGPPRAGRGLGALAGVAAAVLALGVGELLSAFAGTGQSLVGSVGNVVIDNASGGVVHWAIEVFGTNDKPALVIGIVLLSLLAGALLGAASTRRPLVGSLGFAAFGLVGAVCGVRDAQASGGWAVVVAALATATGVFTLRFLLGVAATGRGPAISSSRRLADDPRRARTADSPTTPHASRRDFFAWTGAAGAFGAVAAWGGRTLASRSAVEASRAQISLPAPTNAGRVTSVGVSGSGVETPYITPNADFYQIDTALITPQVDVATWTLQVTGHVDQPFSLTFDDLLAMPQVEEVVTLSCVSNEVGGDLVGNAVWQGVPLTAILDRAGVRPEGTQVIGQSVDGFTAGFPTSVVRDGRVAMVAVGMNGEPLPVVHGFPARLVVAGLYGYVSATKWLSEIRLTGWEEEDGYWMPRGWSKEGPVKTQTRIDVPRRGADLTAGRQPIAGTSWAPTRGIDKVEVQVDDGPWQEARLSDVVSDNTWRQWVLDWDATPGLHQIRARATDGTGQVQTEALAPSAPDGATGWHTIRVDIL